MQMFKVRRYWNLIDLILAILGQLWLICVYSLSCACYLEIIIGE